MTKALRTARMRAFLLSLLMFLLTANRIRAADINVPGDYATIQEAIDNANSGDMIRVNGTYVQPSGSTVVINKQVLIEGQTGAKVETSGNAVLFQVTAVGVTIRNLVIQKTDKTGTHNIIQVLANDFYLNNCNISGQYVIGDPEVSRALEIAPGITGFNITGNTFSALRQPAYINAATGSVINNFVAGTRGWVVVTGSNVTFTGNSWGTGNDANAVDIAFIDEGPNNYPDIAAISQANNGAVVENQHNSLPNRQLSVVYVDDDAGSGGNGTQLAPYNTIAPSVARVAPGGRVLIASGNYDEQVVINKTATYEGTGITKPIINFTGATITGKPAIFDISVDDVTITNIHFNVDLSKLRSAIIASGADIDQITIHNNKIESYGTPIAGMYGDRNAVSVNYGGPTNYRVATNGVNNIAFTNNVITGTLPAAFRSAISADEAGGTFSGNTLQTINHDVLVRFGGNGDINITNNQFNGGGVEVAEHNAGAGTTTISGNTFNGTFAQTSAPAAAVLRLRNNQVDKPYLVQANTFTNHLWGVSLENMRNVTLERNTFTPQSGATGFHHIAVNTKSISSNSALITQTAISAVIRNNFFNGSGVAGGVGVGFFNHDADQAAFGNLDISNNSFDIQLIKAILADAQAGVSTTSVFPAYSQLLGTTNSNAFTTMAPWTQPVTATCNWYGTLDPVVLQQKVDAPADYEPWLVSGTDNDANTAGFQPANGTCDGTLADNDGDGILNAVDCDPLDPTVTTSPVTYFADADGDGFGNPNSTTAACGTTPPTGFVTNNLDCDDTKKTYKDGDGDGFGAGPAIPCGAVTTNTDCDDNDNDNYPGAPELCDGEDNDCDGQVDEGVLKTYYLDGDGDGWGNPALTTQACTAPAGYVVKKGDCRDNDNKVYPGAPELCDGKDNDCDGSTDEGVTTIYYRDADGDGWGNSSQTRRACSRPSGFVTKRGDCNDGSNKIYPGAPELCDGRDNDCDGQVDEGLTQRTFFRDFDGDGRGDRNVTIRACAAPPGFVSNSSDCNDRNRTVYAGAPELCDGLDNDCDGTIDEGLTRRTYYRDADGDGWGNTSRTIRACAAPPGYVSRKGDCNDNNNKVYPGAPVTDGNGIDDDCSESLSQVAEDEELSVAVLDEGSTALKVDVFPNPATAYFTIRVSGEAGKPVQLRVTDMMGRVVEARGNVAANTTHTMGHRYLPGMYLVEATQGGSKVVVKCIKQ